MRNLADYPPPVPGTAVAGPAPTTWQAIRVLAYGINDCLTGFIVGVIERHGWTVGPDGRCYPREESGADGGGKA